jgi:Xaa-Pro aminopeptidase
MEEESRLSSFLFMRVPDEAHSPFLARQQRLRSLMEDRQLSLLVITHLTNIYYLTGFRGSAGIAAFGLEGGHLWVDPRYTLQAGEEACGVTVSEERGPLHTAVGRWIARRRVRKVGYEDTNLTCAQYRNLERNCWRGLHLVPAGNLVEELRLVKDSGEIRRIREAGRVTVEVFEEVLPLIRPGAREADLAAEIDYRMRRRGAEGAAFETIVASGARSALPHARASSKRLGQSELVILDLGAILQGYAADLTRTVFLGKPSRRVRHLYGAVLESQQRVLEALRAGLRAGEADNAARQVLKRRGLDKYFTHSTGHGVGLEVHEKPRLGRGEKTRLEAGQVVTAEPGIYLEGFGGIRIEDTVLVEPNGAEVLTPASKANWIIN